MKRLLLVTILMAIGICPLLADTYCNLEFVDSWRSPYSRNSIGPYNSSLVYNQGFLYIAGSDHIYILEVSDSGTIEFETSIFEPADSAIGEIAIRNNTAYVSFSTYFNVYDVSDPLYFDSIGTCPERLTSQFFFFDSLLLASNGLYIKVFDISDSTSPVHLRDYRTPYTKVGLPAVCEDDFPYICVPAMIYYGGTFPYYDAYIYVADVTDTTSSSHHLNGLDFEPVHWFEAMAKVGDYYVGADGTIGTNITHYIMMDSTFWGTRSIRHESVFRHPRNYMQTLNDSLVYCGGQEGFQIVNVGDTSRIEVVASFENTDTSVFEYYEVFYDCVLQDSFLYVASGHMSLDSDRDTMYVLSFKVDLGFSGQCENENKPDNIEIESYPNPFNSTCSVSYSLAEINHSVSIGIYDIKGNLIESHKNMPSKSEFIWDASGQSSGVYLLKIIGENTSLSKKLIYIS